jgi:hypothetical protein
MKKATKSELRRSLEELVLSATPFVMKGFGETIHLTGVHDNYFLYLREAVHRSEQLLDQATPKWLTDE